MSFDFKKYREEHREKQRAYAKEHYIKNKEAYLHRAREYRKTHKFVMKEEWKIAKKKWADKNKERRSVEYKEYRKRNIMRMRARDQRRIARERGAIGILTLEILQKVYEENIKKYGTLTCYLCLCPIKFKHDHLEHKTPLSRGGSNEYVNLAVACKKCNFSKRNKTEMEYREYALLISTKSS